MFGSTGAEYGGGERTKDGALARRAGVAEALPCGGTAGVELVLEPAALFGAGRGAGAEGEAGAGTVFLADEPAAGRFAIDFAGALAGAVGFLSCNDVVGAVARLFAFCCGGGDGGDLLTHSGQRNSLGAEMICASAVPRIFVTGVPVHKFPFERFKFIFDLLKSN